MFPLRLNAEIDGRSPKEIVIVMKEEGREMVWAKTTDIFYK